MRIHRWHGLAYEFRHSFFRGITVLVICGGVLVALNAGYGIASHPAEVPRFYSGVLYETGGTFHFDFNAFNSYGSSLTGVAFSVSVFSGPPYGSPLAILGGTTDSSGTVDLAISLPNGSYNATILAGPPTPPWTQGFWSDGLVGRGNISFGALTPGTLVPLFSPAVHAVNLPVGFAGETGLRIYFPTWKESCPSGCHVFYALVNLTGGISPVALPESSMLVVGTLDLSVQSFLLGLPPMYDSSPDSVQVEIFSPTGSLLAMEVNVSAWSLTPHSMTWLPGNQAFRNLPLGMIFVAPLLAAIASFSTYARDRNSGVLDSTLVQPITRVGLTTSRFLAVVATVFIALGAGIALTDLFVRAYVGYFVYPAELVSTFLGFAVTGVFFAGLVFLLSHIARSDVLSIAVPLAVYVAFILQIVSSDNGGWNALFNPPTFGDLFTSAFTSSTIIYSRSPPPLEIQVADLVSASLAWAFVPFLLLIRAARTRD